MDKTPTQTDPEVRVYNKGRRTFEHGPHKASPGSFATVPESVAKTWFRLFPDEVVEAGVAQKEIGGIAAELASTRDELAKAKARVAELEAKLEKPAEPEVSAKGGKGKKGSAADSL